MVFPENGQSCSPGADHLNLSRKVSSYLHLRKERWRLETERDEEAGKRKKRKRSRGRHNEEAGDRGCMVFVTVQENTPTVFVKSNSAKKHAHVPTHTGHSRAQTTQHSDSFTRSAVLSPEGVLLVNRVPGSHSGLCHHLRFPHLSEGKPL